MISYIVILVFLSLASSENSNCYWNRECPNLLHSTKTTYETVRGDIRDYPDPECAHSDTYVLNCGVRQGGLSSPRLFNLYVNELIERLSSTGIGCSIGGTTACEAVSIWSLHRHGNRNPGSVGVVMKQLIDVLQPQIIEAYEAGRSKLCAQDIEAFRKWTFNETILAAPVHLTGTGYEELYDIAKRLRHRYPHLFKSGPEDYYFRPTDSQRTIASAMGFVHGFTDETDLNVTFDGPFERDDQIRPYDNCLRYQQDVKGGALLEQQLEDYANTEEYLAMLRDVQERLGTTYQLTQDDVYTLYEICRYHRTWVPTNRDAWCAAFTDEDLVVLEYRDDVRHYYRNGYGSWVTPRLAGPLLKDLRERFQDSVRGQGKNVVSYFSHNAMTEMTFSALGLRRDNFAIEGSKRVPERQWRTSFIAAFSTNMIVVLNRCTESGEQTHRVQFFVNEKETTLCPLSGCTWEQFEEMMKGYDDNLDFCSLDYPEPEFELPGGNSAVGVNGGWLIALQIMIMYVVIF